MLRTASNMLCRYSRCPFVVFVWANPGPPRKGEVMKYALLIYYDPNVEATEAQQAEVMEAYAKFTNDINERGINLGGEALHAIDSATTVRVREGDVLTTDGPFAETKEVLGGFYLIDSPDLDAAIKVAADLPGSWTGSVEVRPVWDWETGEAQ
jgi:hypothetical protein